ncbi:hypothetical protein EGI97_12830 [Stutzerimonas xanthomarina]|nr:hypothetical protein EGI97_12830 [Stutzerimonas xanthomarina]
MADKILHKRSGTPSAVPSAASLELGELALNTADGRAFMKKNDGAVVEIGSNASGYFRTEPITATSAGQTSFTVPGGYTPGAIFVSLNGASLPPADFTATNGTTVVLASGSGIVAGSVLLVHVLSAFEVADALPLGGTAADSSKLGGSAAAEFYRRSNILGTVSQSGGVPTGALIERGSNANGEYVRFADGTQIGTVYKVKAAAVGMLANGVYYWSEPWTFPAAFISAPSITTGAFVAGVLSWGSADGQSIDGTLGYLNAFANIAATADVHYRAIAIGRWY